MGDEYKGGILQCFTGTELATMTRLLRVVATCKVGTYIEVSYLLLCFALSPQALIMATRSHYHSVSEKETEPLTSHQHKSAKHRSLRRWLVTFSLLLLLTRSAVFYNIRSSSDDQTLLLHGGDSCPQYPPMKALSEDRRNFEDEIKNELNSESFFNDSLKRMQGAVRIPTESFDDMGEVGEDKRYDAFIVFQEYLKKTFPLV